MTRLGNIVRTAVTEKWGALLLLIMMMMMMMVVVILNLGRYAHSELRQTVCTLNLGRLYTLNLDRLCAS
jgi:hypothetical protein